jgi:ABC-2 type transport system permease protein
VRTSTDLSSTNRRQLEKQVDDRSIDGFVWLDPESIAAHKIKYIAGSTTDFVETQRVRTAAREALMALEFERNGVSSEKLKELLKPYQMEATQWANGQAQTGGDAQFIIVFVLGFAMYMITVVHGMNVLRAVITEKSSRIMEVLLSSLTPSELMAGKVFGVAAVGVTQVVIWMAAGLLLAAPGMMIASDALKQLTPAVAAFFAVFFLLGFLLYSSLCAAVGSMVNSEQEAQQFQFMIMIPLMLSFFYVFFAIRAPHDPLVIALSIFPFSSPLVMFARVVLGAASPAQIAISLATLFASIAFTIWLCARIYRVGVLMYGKKPTVAEILKWIRYA